MRQDVDKVAVIVRAYNNPRIHGVVERLLEMGMGLAVVVTDQSKDNGVTPQALIGFPADRLRVIELPQGYSWVNALNTGLFSIILENRTRIDSESLRFVLNISCEVNLSSSYLGQMLQRTNSSPEVGVVGTAFRGLKGGQEFPLGSTYNRFPRNTCALWRLEALEEIGWFNAVTDSFGGQEDIYLLIWMLLISDFRFAMVEHRIDLEVGVHYDQVEKERREMEAVRKIVSYLRQLLPPSSDLANKLESILTELQLKV